MRIRRICVGFTERWDNAYTDIMQNKSVYNENQQSEF